MPVLASQVDALTWAYLERRVEAKHAGFSQEGLRTVEITRGASPPRFRPTSRAPGLRGVGGRGLLAMTGRIPAPAAPSPTPARTRTAGPRCTRVTLPTDGNGRDPSRSRGHRLPPVERRPMLVPRLRAQAGRFAVSAEARTDAQQNQGRPRSPGRTPPAARPSLPFPFLFPVRDQRRGCAEGDVGLRTTPVPAW